MKTIKLAAKRLRVTKQKKILRRVSQQGHFKSKESGNVRRAKRKNVRGSSPVFIKLTQPGKVKFFHN